MKKIMDFIYHYIPFLHKLLMKNKIYFRLRHILWNYGGLIDAVDSLEETVAWYKREREFSEVIIGKDWGLQKGLYHVEVFSETGFTTRNCLMEMEKDNEQGTWFKRKYKAPVI